MTGEKANPTRAKNAQVQSAPAEMPGEIEVANALIAHFVENTGFTTVEEDETKTRVSAYYGGVWVDLRVYPMARAVLALFAPILAEREKVDDLGQTEGVIAALEARALAAEAAVLAVAPYVDSIVCYASTVDEHDGNRVAKLVNEAAAAIRAQIAAPGAAMEAP